LRASRRTAFLLLAALSVASGVAVSAHRRDEYLHAARIAVEPGRVTLEMQLTPGIAVADGIIGDIDGDRDGVLSPFEQRAYAQLVLSRVALHVDEAQPLRLTLMDSRFPAVAAMRTGDASIALRVEAAMPPLTAGAHRLLFRNGNEGEGTVYLANALVPETDRVAVTGQQRRFDQSELIIAFEVRETVSGRRWAWFGLAGAVMLAVPLTTRTRFRRGT
jgi:hypothetical protein